LGRIYSDTINLSDGSKNVRSDILSIGASDVNAFAGTSDKSTGFELSNLGFALAIIKPTDTQDDRTFTSLGAWADAASFIGIDDLTVSGNDIFVAMNLSSDENVFADYTQKQLEFGIGGDTSVTFDFDGSDGQFARVEGDLSLGISDFVFMDGLLVFENASQTVQLKDTSNVETNMFTFSAMGIDIFAGNNGSSESAAGLSLNNANVAMAVLKPEDTSDKRSWLALKADMDQGRFIGVDGIDADISDFFHSYEPGRWRC
jgi:hypothetical protein